MKTSLSISILATGLLLATSAAAQISLTPPAAQPPVTKPAELAKEPTKPAQAIKTKPHMVKKPAAPAAQAKPATPTAPAAAATPAPAPDDPNVDLVYGAYQRGQYKTAFDLATARAQTGDIRAMTMLGVLYSNALGVKRDYAKAVDWYKRASDAGDREAMLELAMMRLAGRGGPTDKQEAV